LDLDLAADYKALRPGLVRSELSTVLTSAEKDGIIEKAKLQAIEKRGKQASGCKCESD
jgi:hypothetical protein